eukprot:Skav204117  [mRNA]  locus=scaffold5190:190961:192067:- [translate_table: standard]
MQDAGMTPKTRRLDLSACAKCNSRVGEASHPGPRRSDRTIRSAVQLADVELLEPSTVEIRHKVWQRFVRWSDETVGRGVAVDWVTRAPGVFVMLLVAFGYELFDAGESLHLYRQMLAYVQREFVLLKPYMSTAWATVSKWEKVEPLTHCVPMPEPLLHAMTTLCISWGWRHFAAAIIFSFYSVSRIGEVIRARRRDVLTPRDLLDESDKVYLKILNPKTRNRGARVQHSSAEDSRLIKFVASVWDQLMPDEMLYSGSQSAFRSRWDALLRHIQVSKSFGLTPGSLRGGGAVAAHRRGVSVNDLMWKMRVTQQRTLFHYLQETAAVSLLPQLSEGTRYKIKLLCFCFVFVKLQARSAQVCHIPEGILSL